MMSQKQRSSAVGGVTGYSCRHGLRDIMKLIAACNVVTCGYSNATTVVKALDFGMVSLGVGPMNGIVWDR